MSWRTLLAQSVMDALREDRGHYLVRFVPGNFSAYLPPLAALGSLELASYSDFNTTVSTYQQPSNFQATEKYFFLACKLSAIIHIHSIRKDFSPG